MTATVQATCPGCRNVLRIPVDWAAQALRCKKCGTVLQAKKKPASRGCEPPDSPAPPIDPTTHAPPLAENPAYIPAPVNPGVHTPGSPVPYPYPYPTGQPDPLAVVDDELPTGPIRRQRYRRGNRGSPLIGGIVALLVCGAIVAGGWLAYNKLVPQKSRTTTEAPEVVARGKDSGPPSPSPVISDPFPRRVLFIHVSNYIYFNPLSAGTSSGKDMPTKSAERLAFELRIPTDRDTNQLFVLSDTAGGREFHPPVKSVLMQTYDRFFQSSRLQDRVVVYFGGHAVAADGKAYLVPVEGEPGNPNSFIPLDDFYAKLAACKAQQKVVLFDVCRLDPARGEEKPGGEPMSDELSKKLLAAPPGVQVAVSCGPGQNAQENGDTGSEFLTAFRVSAERAKRAGKSNSQTPDDPILLASLLDGMRAYLGGGQSVQSAGGESEAKVAYAKDEPPAARFDWPAAPKGVSADEVTKILRQVSLPGIRADLSVPADLPRVYPFAEDVMKDYRDDGVTDEQILRDGEKYPVRKATLEAVTKMNDLWRQGGGPDGKVGIMDEFKDTVDDSLKKTIQSQQMPVARIAQGLEEVMAELDLAGKELAKEKSKRWQAAFQYARAQALLRWSFLQEYNGALGKIRTDSLPQDPKNKSAGLRLVSTSKVSKSTKDKVTEAQDLLDKLAADHQGTPYEVIAKLHRHISIGLEWRVIPQDMKKDEEGK